MPKPRRQYWIPCPPSRLDLQLPLPLDVPPPRLVPAPDDDWRREWDEHVASLETHVVDGVFRPPLKEGEDDESTPRPYAGRRRNGRVHDERIPAHLFSYDEASRTFKTTYTRLRDRGYLYCSLITVVDGEEDIPFRLFQVAQRRDEEWTLIRFRHFVGKDLEHELIIVNNALPPSSEPAGDQQRAISVVRDGDVWVAKFEWSAANKEKVRRAGFEFASREGRWITRDRRAAARLEALVRSSEAPVPRRRKPFLRFRRG